MIDTLATIDYIIDKVNSQIAADSKLEEDVVSGQNTFWFDNQCGQIRKDVQSYGIWWYILKNENR